MSYTRLEDLRDKIFGPAIFDTSNKIKIVGALVVDRWTREAAKRLKTTYSAYVKSLGVEKQTSNSITISLPGPDTDDRLSGLAKMVEFGFGGGGIGSFGGAYFMGTHGQRLHETIGQSDTATGKQTVVNFSFNRGQASAAVGQDIAALFRKIAKKQGKSVHSKRGEDGKTTWGARLPGSYSQRLKPHHAATVASGMFSKGKSAGRSGRIVSGGYSTLRVVPKKRKPGSLSWVSKGIKPRDIARRYVVPQIPEILRDAGVL